MVTKPSRKRRVCRQCCGLGVRHIQLLLLFGCVTVGTILSTCHIVAIKLAKETPTDSSTYYEDHFKLGVEKKNNEQILQLECTMYYVLFAGRCAAGILTCKVNNKAFLLIIMALFATQSYILPSLAQRYSWTSLLGMRAVVGLLEGSLMPIIYQIIARWSPFTETARSVCFVAIAPYFGRFCVTGLVGFIGRSIGGWTSVFYISGNLGILWCVAWFTFGADDPKKCFYISLDEKYYLNKNSHDIVPVHWDNPIPWKNLFKAPSTYVITAIHILIDWTTVFYVEVSFMTTYFKEAHKYSEKKVGVAFYFMPVAFLPLLHIILAIISDVINNREYFPVIYQRKTCASIGFWGAAVCSIFIGYASKDVSFITVAFYFYLIAQVFINVSFTLAPFDLAPNYAGLLFGITSAIGYIPPTLIPQFVQAVVGDMKREINWNYMFYYTAFCFYIANFVYTITFTGALEDYNKVKLIQITGGSASSSLRSTVQYEVLKLTPTDLRPQPAAGLQSQP